MPCIGSLSFGFTDAWARTLDNAFSGFDPASFPYRDLVLMLAVWAVAALFLSAPQIAEAGDTSQRRTWLQNVLGGLSQATRHNIVFFAILVVAGYLSIAAIVAIPGLQEPAVAPAEVSADRLKQNLDTSLAQMQLRLTPVISFTSPLAGAEANAAALNQQQQARQQSLDMYAKLIQDALVQADNDRSAAVTAYEVAAVGRKGSQETVQHFQAIDAWYRGRLNAVESQIGDCRLSIQRADDAARFLSSLPPDNLASGGPGAFQLADAMWSSQQSAARTACQLSPRATQPPERPDLGSNLGPFSYVASWLLRTESLPLAQIVGMLGFGLLGSAVSSFLRQGTRRQTDGSLVKDLPTLIIRGATAAVVVFLAVKGGLAIFASGTGEPNSYVLLLTCLVAAAYSEDVWKTAREWLKKQTGDKDKDKGGEKVKDEEQDKGQDEVK
jgi:enamine deaminase RidA (YjgF/YER057c/UK114 family)